MKLKKYLGTALKVGGLLGVLGSTECATYNPRLDIAESLKEILKDEFDYVNYMTICRKRDDKNNCLEEEYVVRGHKNYGHMKFAVFGANINHICEVGIYGKNFYLIFYDGTIITKEYKNNKNFENLLNLQDKITKDKLKMKKCNSLFRKIIYYTT